MQYLKAWTLKPDHLGWHHDPTAYQQDEKMCNFLVPHFAISKTGQEHYLFYTVVVRNEILRMKCSDQYKTIAQVLAVTVIIIVLQPPFCYHCYQI